MIDEVYLDSVEVKGFFYDIEATVEFELENCECTSMCGDQSVTERWQQLVIEEVVLDKVFLYEDDELVEKKKDDLSEDFVCEVSELVIEKLELSL